MPILRVAVATRAGELEIGASFGAWIGHHRTGERPSRIDEADKWRLSSERGRVMLSDGAGRPRGAVSDTVFVFPIDREQGAVTVNGKAYRGELLIWSTPSGLTAVNVIDAESYLRGVVPLEIGPQPPESQQAVAAQAVAARSYTLATMGRWRADGFDLLSTVEDQAYGGIGKEKAVCTDAIEQTRGVVLSWDHSPIRAYYSSTCGGTTAGIDEVWGRPPIEYLRTVRDQSRGAEDSFCESSPRFRWVEEWSGAEFEKMLEPTLRRRDSSWSRARYGHLTGIAIKERGASRRVSDLRLSFEHGNVDLGGDEIRWTIRRPNGEGLRSCLLTKVETSKKGSRISRVRVSGRGYGHGVGMCQFGAMGMARSGYDHTQILRFYYRGARLVRAY